MKTKPLLPPKPVHPRAIKHHGFLGISFVKQHMMTDKRWTLESLMNEFKHMTTFLTRYSLYNHRQKIRHRKHLDKTFRDLKKQCRDGRSLLKKLRMGDSQNLHNILKGHKDMMRLYHKMPFQMVTENINQRTFVMRKERDRLSYRLEKLKAAYEVKLKEKAKIENRLIFNDLYKLKEEGIIIDFKEKVKNSEARLNAVRAINSTYKKIIQILRHDAIFYEPILHSLELDVEDQSNFIKHILDLGSPALVKFKQLKDEYLLMDNKSRRSSRLTLNERHSFRSKIPQSKLFQKAKEPKPTDNIIYVVQRYVRETQGMRELRKKFEEIEKVIKKIQMATVCSKETDIYRRIKNQMKNNLEINAQVEKDMYDHFLKETKLKWGSVLKAVMVNNLGKEGIDYLENVTKLKEDIKKEDIIEEQTLEYMKNKSHVFVLLRFFLWNLYDIMRHVGPRRIPKIQYPVDYLKLPLLTFEKFISRAVRPDPFVENIDQLLQIVSHKLRKLVKTLDVDLSPRSIQVLTDLYCNEYLRTEEDLPSTPDSKSHSIHIETDYVLEDVKDQQKVLGRKQIKMASTRILEESIKKDQS